MRFMTDCNLCDIMSCQGRQSALSFHYLSMYTLANRAKMVHDPVICMHATIYICVPNLHSYCTCITIDGHMFSRYLLFDFDCDLVQGSDFKSETWKSQTPFVYRLCPHILHVLQYMCHVFSRYTNWYPHTRKFKYILHICIRGRVWIREPWM